MYNTQIKLIIFDFDGTLIDTRGAIISAKQKTMKLMGLSIADEEACASTIGLSSKIGFQKLYPELPDATLDTCVREYRRIFEEEKVLIPPTLFSGVTETLDKIKEMQITCSIASSRNVASLNDFLRATGLERYFTYKLGGEDTPLLKPNPDPVLKTLKDLGYKKEIALVVGDMPMDILMGKNAGVTTCGVTYGNAKKNVLEAAGADYLIDKIEDLLNLIKNENITYW